jgi:hypothetical protein
MRSVMLIVALFVSSQFTCAQSPEDVYHAPDGNTREMITSIFISPVTNAPFQATVTAEWTKHLPDGNSTVVKNHRLVVRDSQGRIYPLMTENR